MNAWVFRHLDELQRIYGADSGSTGDHDAAPDCVQVPSGCVQVVERDLQAESRGALRPLEESAQTSSQPNLTLPGPSSTAEAPQIGPGSVVRCETPDGPDIILTPARRQLRPRR